MEAPVQAQSVGPDPFDVHVMPAGHRPVNGPGMPHVPGMPPGPQSAPPQYEAVAGGHEVVGVVVVLVVVAGVATTGAQRSFAASGVTSRVPNWSVTVSAGGVVFWHFTL